ncbi:hypothetical protein FF38_14338 [Lucilia cuprina]|uniref:Uncharacterized protein n=1 Tax=Lucilia cuprina TaxID=7375 RepID=A0A0L0CG85_LUCCU|nr:hypothetical protein FF38_14338 [Lucilia cuprina]
MFFKSTAPSRPGSVTFNTASTAMGANKLLCCETTLEFKDVEALLIKVSRSFNSIGLDISFKISIALFEQRWNESEMAVGWMPLCKSFSQASNKAPAITTTEVVPSPASTSWARLSSTNILAAGCKTFICFKMVAPSLVMDTSPFPDWIILSMPRGPKLVRMASETAEIGKRFFLEHMFLQNQRRR